MALGMIRSGPWRISILVMGANEQSVIKCGVFGGFVKRGFFVM